MFYFKKTIQKSFLVINGAAPTAQLLFVRRKLVQKKYGLVSKLSSRIPTASAAVADIEAVGSPALR